MATNKVVIEAQKLEACDLTGGGDTLTQVKILQVPGKCGPTTAAGVSKGETFIAPLKDTSTVLCHQPTPSTVQIPGPQTSSPAVMVVAKVATTGGVNANAHPQVTKPVLSQVASMNPTSMQGRTVVITVPRSAGPQPVAVAPRPPQTATTQLPANIQIPPGELQQDTMIICNATICI